MNKKTYKAKVEIINIDPDEYPDFFKEGVAPWDAVREVVYEKLHDRFAYTLWAVVEE